MRTAIAAGLFAGFLAASAAAQTVTPANAPDVCRTRADRIYALGQARDQGAPKYRLEAELEKSGEMSWARDKLDLLYFDPTVTPADAAQWFYNGCRKDAVAKK